MLLVDRRITRRDLARDVDAAIGTEIARALTSRGRVTVDDRETDHDEDGNDSDYDIPEWVADRVNDFVPNAGMYPFVKEWEHHAYIWGVAKWTDRSPDRVQEFYGALEMEVMDRRSRARKARAEEVEGERDREMDVLVSRVVEVVEGVVSSLFYHRWVLSCCFIGMSSDWGC